MVSDDIYAALSAGLDWVDRIDDTKLPDGYVLAPPTGSSVATVLTYSCVSDVPTDVDIDGEILMSVSRWQVSVRSTDLLAARTAKDAVIAALHGYSGPTIGRCDFENCPGELFESSVLPFEYHIPLDFMIMSTPYIPPKTMDDVQSMDAIRDMDTLQEQ